MTTRVVPVVPRTAAGDTVMVDGRPTVVLHLLPRLAGRPPSARVTHEPPCRLCETPLHWQQPEHGWRCSACSDTPSNEQLAEWAREHVVDGVRAGRGHREHDRRHRQVARGAPGAAVLLLRTAAAGGALSRAALIDGVRGAERRALRDAGDRPLSAERCRAAAVELDSLTPRTYDVCADGYRTPSATQVDRPEWEQQEAPKR